MSYYDLYQKYKNKYLKLKNQLGGEGLNLFLPCDIHNITEKFMIKVRDFSDKFSDFRYIYHDLISVEYNFIQDPIIIFNQIDKKYIIRLNDCDYHIDSLKKGTENNTFRTKTELLYGGNYISTPPNTLNNNLSIIITTKCLDKKNNDELDILINFIQANLINTQKIINISCSFPHYAGGIHIDELLCPMPYKSYELFPRYNMNYKIWIYKINDIIFEGIDIKIKNFEKEVSIKTKFIDYTPEELFNIAEQINKEQQKLRDVPWGKKEAAKQKIIIKGKNDVLLNYVELELNKYPTFFNLIREGKYEQFSQSYEKLKNLEILRRELIDKFNTELEENKRIIGSAIFGESYEKNKDEINKNFFVEYPIDLNFEGVNLEGFYGFNMIKPPIFNRVFIKLEDKNICFIPVKNLSDKILTDFMTNEQKLMIENINFEYVDTYTYHIEDGAGGNIHCLSKQIFRN